MKQTAVEWFFEQMKKCNMTVSVHNTSHQNVIDFYSAIEQAKEMEKQQIIEAIERGFDEGCFFMDSGKTELKNGEHYYNKTFNK